MRALLAEVADRPFDFDLFNLVRCIEAVAPDLPRIGTSISPRSDPVRFGQEPSLAFAPSSIFSCKPGVPGRLTVHSFGLLGPNGPLPLHLTEYARERQLNFGDPTLARFLDVFHHRALSLFYRAWAINQPTVNADRPETDKLAFYIACLFGMGAPSLTDRDSIHDLAKVHYAGRLAPISKCAEGLERLIGDFFGVRCHLEQFVGRWMELPADAKCRLGESPETGALGRTAIVGDRMWDVQQSFRLVMGPMRMADYRRLLPCEPAFGRLRDWVRLYCGFEFVWDVQLVLDRRDVPRAQLGGDAALGWTTWLTSETMDRDPDDLLVAGEPGG
ncbi:MAG: type VI secretion system baseplate subunit TssG [Phycisphaeraceae bacterium]|nr:type VI secretion system baseplate subunit TssG [Phycisphaeraceae bacterium]